MSEDVEKLKKRLRPTPSVPKKQIGLSTSSTLLNLAMTGKVDQGFICGYYYLFVGDSNSGKSFCCLSCLAEAANNPNFDNYRLILDGPEHGAQMDMVKFFGKKMADRLEPPEISEGESVYSETIEDFFFHLDDLVELNKPFIYVLDSVDVLDSEDASKKFKENKILSRKDKKTKGSYGDGKAKIISANLRRYLTPLYDTNSILIIINQTRDNINAGMFEPPTVRSGGHALEFYAQVQLWSSVKKRLTKEINEKKRVIGRSCKINIKRSRFTGEDSISVNIPIYKSTGVDDVGSMVEWLVEESHWKKVKGKIDAKELDLILSIDDLIEEIESKNLEENLRNIVSLKWGDLLELTKVKRKKRYE